jgi:hypothetical protein
MFSMSSSEFMAFVSMRRRGIKEQQAAPREKVLQPEQLINTGKKELRHLATCPACDAVVAADLLDQRSGLCPHCHAESQFRR